LFCLIPENARGSKATLMPASGRKVPEKVPDSFTECFVEVEAVVVTDAAGT
jgi:hypothetical protein